MNNPELLQIGICIVFILVFTFFIIIKKSFRKEIIQIIKDYKDILCFFCGICLIISGGFTIYYGHNIYISIGIIIVGIYLLNLFFKLFNKLAPKEKEYFCNECGYYRNFKRPCKHIDKIKEKKNE